jgi:Lrp/AsnC family transcriptional regulator for asnA, asnC and gidA
MDRIDKKIIDILQYDGRASNAAIARDVGVSEGTVRRRLKKLIDDDYIKVVAITEPTKMGMY